MIPIYFPESITKYLYIMSNPYHHPWAQFY